MTHTFKIGKKTAYTWGAYEEASWEDDGHPEDPNHLFNKLMKASRTGTLTLTTEELPEYIASLDNSIDIYHDNLDSPSDIQRYSRMKAFLTQLCITRNQEASR